MKFCVSTGVGTWTNWSTFDPDPDHSPDAGTLKYESRRSVEVGQTGTSLRAGYRSRDALAVRYSLLNVVVQGPESFPDLVDFSVRRTVAELWGVKLAQFSDFGLCRRYMRSTKCPSTFFATTCGDKEIAVFVNFHWHPWVNWLPVMLEITYPITSHMHAVRKFSWDANLGLHTDSELTMLPHIDSIQGSFSWGSYGLFEAHWLTYHGVCPD